MKSALSFVISGSRECRRLAVPAILLVVLISAVYGQVASHDFITFDDEDYVYGNRHVAEGLTGKSIAWAFTSMDYNNWHPVTWLSHMVDVQLFGMNPGAHHLTNVVIHAASALLLFLLFFRLTQGLWQSFFVAALFGIHPVHVESVAWIAERKDVLSAFLGFLTLLMYARFAADRKPRSYALALLFFVVGLMAKPMLVTLPLLMLLLDFWPLDRLRGSDRPSDVVALAKEKIPFFACSILAGIVTLYAQHEGGVMRTLNETPPLLRIENAVTSYLRYIGKMLWPHDLAILYPYPHSIPLWQSAGSLVVLLLVSAYVIQARHRTPWLATGWFWFIINLLPVTGLIQVGNQSMADRYTYIPAVGLFIMAAWGVSDLTGRLPHRQSILGMMAGTVVCASAALSWHQFGYWKDSVTLYTHALQVTTDNALIHNLMGISLVAKWELEAAIGEYETALAINPMDDRVHFNLGVALAGKGALDRAIGEYREALRLNLLFAKPHNNLGLALAAKGDLDGAINEYREAIRTDPDNDKPYNNLGIAMAKKGDFDGAVSAFREALKKNPKNTQAYNNLQRALAINAMQR